MNTDGRTQFQSMQEGPEAVDHPEENVVYHTVHIRRLTQATELSLKINTLQDFANEKEFPVDITIEMKSLEPYEQIEIPDHGHYTDMTLSPLGLWIWDATIQGSELHESLPQHDIYLVFQDGSRMGYSAAEYEEKFSAGEELSWEADQVPYKEQTYISIVFQNKIDIHEVTAIEIDGERHASSSGFACLAAFCRSIHKYRSEGSLALTFTEPKRKLTLMQAWCSLPYLFPTDTCVSALLLCCAFLVNYSYSTL